MIKKAKEAEAEGMTTIWTMRRDKVWGYVHPTQKPVELIEYALRNSSKVHDDVVRPLLRFWKHTDSMRESPKTMLYNGTRPSIRSDYHREIPSCDQREKRNQMSQ
jgi:hypothetical protein